MTLKSDLNLLNTFFNQTNILAVFNDITSKGSLFFLIRFVCSTIQGSIHRDLIKKMYHNFKTRFKCWLFLNPLLKLTRTPFTYKDYFPFYFKTLNWLKDLSCPALELGTQGRNFISWTLLIDSCKQSKMILQLCYFIHTKVFFHLFLIMVYPN